MSDSLLALLRWYADMGVDLAIGEEPRDYLAHAGPQAAPVVAPSPPPAPIPPLQAASAPSIENLARDAARAAAAATTLDELRAELERFEGCGLKTTATQLVFGDGRAGAQVMFVGEAPGADEDRQGVPFVGRAGRLLNRMLAAIGLAREDVYISNIVPWRPPGNRTPSSLETAACLPFTRRQIELVGPQALVCLGAPSAQTLLGIKEGITRARGRWLSYQNGDATIRAMAMLHPAYLLRQPAQKALAWRDLRLLARELERLRAEQPAGE
ncbi:uracil-DNA glycosylase [Methylocella sp.]|uniref:uracil-DNA glycosylase n=1 Tax=Methylocella sp. TaxID=1978226 RepID=UPI003784AC35